MWCDMEEGERERGGGTMEEGERERGGGTMEEGERERGGGTKCCISSGEMCSQI